MDNVDAAQEREAFFRSRMLGKLQQFAPVKQDGKDCLACGAEIDEGRRSAVPGACLCVLCQDRLERLRR